MSATVRFTTPFTWTARSTVVFVKPGWQMAHWTPDATAGCHALVSTAPPGAAWQPLQVREEGGFQTGAGKVPPPMSKVGPPAWQ